MKKAPSTSSVSSSNKETSFHTLAVIDIGTTAIRMNIAQSDEHRMIKPLESLQHGLSLGKDTFSRGFISRESIEDCVKALKEFRCTNSGNIRSPTAGRSA